MGRVILIVEDDPKNLKLIRGINHGRKKENLGG